MINGFDPIATPDARVLILGTVPSQRSLEAGEYYAHPQNALTICDSCGFGPRVPPTRAVRERASLRRGERSAMRWRSANMRSNLTHKGLPHTLTAIMQKGKLSALTYRDGRR